MATPRSNPRHPAEGSDPAPEAERDEARARLVRAFLHEARSPLNALAIYLELLENRVRGEPAPEGRPDASPQRLVGRAQDQVRRIEELLRLFGEAAAPRAEDGADLARATGAVARFAAHLAVRQGCQLGAEAPGPAPVRADPRRLSEALLRLASDMIGAPEGTKLLLRVGVQERRALLEATAEGAPEGHADLFSRGAEALTRAGAQVERRGEDALLARFEIGGQHAGTAGPAGENG